MLNAQIWAIMTTNPNIKQLIDETDPNNVYIWTIKRENSILDTDKTIWQIQKITKTWSITATNLDVDWIETWNKVWDDRATYTYF
jgi:hypothetical protein